MPLDRARSSGMRFLLALFAGFAVLLAAPVHATGTVAAGTSYQAVAGGGYYGSPQTGSLAAACQYVLDTYNAGITAGHPANPQTSETYWVTPCTSSGWSLRNNWWGQQVYGGPFVISSACPANSTGTPPSCTCSGSYVPNAGATACEMPNACSAEVNTSPVSNFTLGWAVNPSILPIDSTGNMVGPWLAPKPGDYVCVPTGSGSGCRRFIDAQAQVYVSNEPAASGLYRVSVDYVTVPQGTTCTPPAASPADPATANPPCPGFVGVVNGVTRCVPKLGDPPLPSPTNAASSPPAGAPVSPGNPPAGDKPTAGAGSGTGDSRTPVSGGGGAGANPISGGGGNSGGSSSATGGGSTGGPKSPAGGGATGGGTSGAGTEGTTEPIPPCGLPNTPKCRLDETGTGTGEGALAAAKGQFDTEAGKQNTQVSAAGTSVTGVAWNWAFTLPAGACTPFDFSTRLGPVTINPCTNTWFALFRSAMGYFFFGLTGFYIWHKATSAPTGGK